MRSQNRRDAGVQASDAFDPFALPSMKFPPGMMPPAYEEKPKRFTLAAFALAYGVAALVTEPIPTSLSVASVVIGMAAGGVWLLGGRLSKLVAGALLTSVMHWVLHWLVPFPDPAAMNAYVVAMSTAIVTRFIPDAFELVRDRWERFRAVDSKRDENEVKVPQTPRS